MLVVAQLCDFLDAFAPPVLAAEWDNVGLLVGDRSQGIQRVMTCLTITPDTAEAIRERADTVGAPSAAVPSNQAITADEPAGRMLLD
jgi:putative NIF3 family GTP cyclohydrolase 1 type 2